MELIIKNCTIGLQWHSFNYSQCIMATEFDPQIRENVVYGWWNMCR